MSNVIGFLRRTSAVRIKSRRARHSWQTVGGYDPERDGSDPQWGRAAIECKTCGERRRVFCSLDDPRLTGGCWRRGSARWRKGDLLVRDGALDEFDAWLPNGKVRTWNAGGHFHESSPEALHAA